MRDETYTLSQNHKSIFIKELKKYKHIESVIARAEIWLCVDRCCASVSVRGICMNAQKHAATPKILPTNPKAALGTFLQL